MAQWGRPSACDRCGECEKCMRAAYMREWYARCTFEERRKLREGRDLEAARECGRDRHTRMKDDPEYMVRRKASSSVNNAIRDGRMNRESCEVCGAWAHAHHDDYSKPLNVRWLCPERHADHHVRGG